MNIQDLKSNTTWQEASNTINNNNNKISLAIATLENATLKNKGYFTTEEKLKEAVPNPTIGSKAYVGTSEPYAIYIVENGVWVDSGYTGGDEIVAKITTDRIEDGAVTSEKIATSAFDSTLSVSGKIAPADVVGVKLTELDQELNNIGSTIVDTGINTDLDISDEQGNVLARFANGHIQVKNFSSVDALESIQAILSNTGFNNVPEFDEETNYSVGDIVRYGKYVYVFTSAHTAGKWNSAEAEKTVLISESQVEVMDNTNAADLDISDENGNVIMRLKDGHIKTKNFDSSNFNSSNQNNIEQEDIFNPFVIPAIPSQNGTDIENQLINLNTATASEIYNLYDSLINRSKGYITKEILGKDSSGQYDIWRLTLSPKFTLTAGNSNINTGTYSRTSRKVIIEPNVHGRPYDPIDATFTVFWLCKFLVDDYKTNDVARYLRNNYTFIIIPQANPWSMDNNSYGNYNGVNINRNYDYNFVPNKSFDYGTNSGPSAFSEKETQYIRDTVLANTDAYAWMDIHSWGDANRTKAFYTIKGAPHTFTMDRAFKVFQNTQSIIDGVDVRFFKDYDSEGWGPAWGEKVIGIWHPHLECGCRVASGDTSAFTSAALTSNFYNLIGFFMFNK